MRADGLPARGILFVLSAPSGTGKSSLAARVVSEVPGLRFSVSYTTRSRRNGELDGKEYHFVSDREFDAMVAGGELLEWAQVHDRRYGTGRTATERALDEGEDLLLDIDVQGARQVRARGDACVSIFVLPPSFETLAARLRARGSDSPAQVQQRLGVARHEVEEYKSYDYLVLNEDLSLAVASVSSIVRAERCRVPRNLALAEGIVRTFPAVS
jgi:guanylate kinase